MELHATFQTDCVLASFRQTGSFDPDVLAWHRSELLHRARAATRRGIVFAVLGLIATLTVVGAPVGAPLLWAGWMLHRLGARHVRTVERVFEAYTRPDPRSMKPEGSQTRGGS